MTSKKKPVQVQRKTRLFKNGMKAIDYLDHFTTTDSKTDEKTTYYLPNNALEKEYYSLCG
ncbi:MAG: hypothetical protein JWP44_1389 [Mucilaginibacter sp.]|nr:hypothetical protein [Mucilaginibacter sp.]